MGKYRRRKGDLGSKTTRAQKICVLIPLVFLIVCYVIPIFIMGMYSFWEIDYYGKLNPVWNLDQYQVFFENSVYPKLLLKSLKTAAVNCVACLLIAYPLAYFIAKLVKPKWRYTFLFLTILPSWTSFLIRTYSWILMLGENGVINYVLQGLKITDHPLTMAFTSGAVSVSLIQIYLPYMVLPIFNSIDKIDDRYVDAAKCLGAKGWQWFYEIIFKLSLPGIISGSIIVLIPTIGEYVVPMILGGNSGMMYSNAVTSQFTITNWPLGAALAMILLIVIMAIFGLYSRIMKIEELWSSAL